jgi:hypothetical protein
MDAFFGITERILGEIGHATRKRLLHFRHNRGIGNGKYLFLVVFLDQLHFRDAMRQLGRAWRSALFLLGAGERMRRLGQCGGCLIEPVIFRIVTFAQ